MLALIAYLTETRKVDNAFLIAAPAAVVANWEKEAASWLPSAEVTVYKGSTAYRRDLLGKLVHL